MAEGARLESVFRGNSNVGSNPTLSASLRKRSLRKAVAPEPTGRRRTGGRLLRLGEPCEFELSPTLSASALLFAGLRVATFAYVLVDVSDIRLAVT